MNISARVWLTLTGSERMGILHFAVEQNLKRWKMRKAAGQGDYSKTHQFAAIVTHCSSGVKERLN